MLDKDKLKAHVSNDLQVDESQLIWSSVCTNPTEGFNMIPCHYWTKDCITGESIFHWCMLMEVKSVGYWVVK